MTSHAYPATIPASAAGVGKYLGSWTWAEITWTIILVAIFQMVLSYTRWGLHTVAVGGNILGASEAGISIPKIKYGNFMITGFMGALIGLMITFQTNSIDPSNASYTPMFYAIAGAVIGGTALAGGSGTIIGAFLGTLVLAILFDGFNLIGISANPQPIILGGAILVAMIANVQLATAADGQGGRDEHVGTGWRRARRGRARHRQRAASRLMTCSGSSTSPSVSAR